MSKAIKSDENKKLIRKKKDKPYAKTDSTAGAKSKFDSVKDEVLKRILEGSSVKDRCGGLISAETYYQWISIGNKDKLEGLVTIYSEFSDNIKECEREYRQTLINSIKSHAPKDWKAMSWLLERSDPETYKLKDKVEMKQELEVSQKAILEIPDNGRRKT